MYQPAICRTIRCRAIPQTYRHLIQQAIVRQEMRLMRPSSRRGMVWETSSIAALFSAAAVCGMLAQLHLG